MKLLDRVKNILLQPKAEWAVIEPEPSDPKTLYSSYIAIVAIIPAAASFLNFVLFTGAFGMRVSVGGALIGVIVQYVLSLVMVFVVAFVADALAPSFDGRRNLNQALKLTAYSVTAAWVAGIFVLLPFIGWLLMLLGTLYSLYLFYLGAPLLMKVPEQKAILYTLVVVILAIIVGVVIAMFNAAITGRAPTGMMRGMM